MPNLVPIPFIHRKLEFRPEHADINVTNFPQSNFRSVQWRARGGVNDILPACKNRIIYIDYYCLVIESWSRVPDHQPETVREEETECDGVEEDAEPCDDGDDGMMLPTSQDDTTTTTPPVNGTDSDVFSVSLLLLRISPLASCSPTPQMLLLQCSPPPLPKRLTHVTTLYFLSTSIIIC